MNQTMKQTFNTLSKTMRAITAAFLLATPAFAQSNDNSYPTRKPLVERNPEFNIRSVYDEFSKTTLGLTLINHIDAQDIRVHIDTTETAVSGYNPVARTITLTPSSGGLETCLSQLAYHLREAQQYTDLDTGTMEQAFLSPAQFWTLKRYEEADARAFSAYIMAFRELQKKDPNAYSSLPGEIQDVVDHLADEMRNTGGVSLTRYRELALEPTLAQIGDWPVRVRLTPFSDAGFFGISQLEDFHENLMQQIKQRHSYIEKEIKSLSSLPAEEYAEKVAALKQRLDTAPDAAAFEQYLRRFGGTSVDISAPTSLQSDDIDANTILGIYAFQLGGDPDTLEDRIDQLSQFMTEQGEKYRTLRRAIESLPAEKPVIKKAVAPKAAR